MMVTCESESGHIIVIALPSYNGNMWKWAHRRYRSLILRWSHINFILVIATSVMDNLVGDSCSRPSNGWMEGRVVLGWFWQILLPNFGSSQAWQCLGMLKQNSTTSQSTWEDFLATCVRCTRHVYIRNWTSIWYNHIEIKILRDIQSCKMLQNLFLWRLWHVGRKVNSVFYQTVQWSQVRPANNLIKCAFWWKQDQAWILLS